MSSEDEPINPYQAPTAVNDKLISGIRSFQIGEKEITTVFVESSIWTGITTYEQTAADETGPEYRGPCQFEVGTEERHEFKIEVDDTGKTNVYVDDQLIESNLFASLRTQIQILVVAFGSVIGLITLLLSLLFFQE